MKRFALLVLIASCTTTESEHVLTSGIYASISASSKGDGKTTVSATLFVGSPIGLNFVELTGDDSLVAKTAGMSKTMQESELLNVVGHHADFPVDAEGAQFEVVFDRAVDGGAPSSVATLPAKFDITNPPASGSRAAAITLAWSPAGSPDAMSWEAKGDCIEDESSPITGDPGTVTIAANTLTKRMGAMIEDNCAVTFTIKRSKAGQLDPNYGKGGTVFGVQYRAAVVATTP